MDAQVNANTNHADEEQMPTSASALFGEELPKAVHFARMLVERSDELGLLGPRELPKLWSRHILNSAIVGELLESGDRVQSVVDGLELRNVHVIRMRAEDVGDAGYDVATARAVAATDKLLKLLVPLVRASSDGRVIAIKGAKVQQEIADAAKVIQKLKLAEVSTLVLGESRIPESVTLLLARVKHRE